MSEFQRSECFIDRPVRRSGLVNFNNWQLKQFDISFDDAPVSDFATGVNLALNDLPLPAQTRDRPGVGFLIRHAGREAHYVVLAWWDNQNELLTRIFIRDAAAQTPWRDAAGKFSFCIWDMKVFWHERNAFVKHFLTPPAGPDEQGYLNDVL